LTYCQETRDGSCFYTVFCSCVHCGINLCYQHSYSDRGEYLCANCFVKNGNKLEICHVCEKFIGDSLYELCERCHEITCCDCFENFAIDLKNPGGDLDDFESGNDIRKWCRLCIDKWVGPKAATELFFPGSNTLPPFSSS